MALDCSPQTIATDSTCFRCIPEKDLAAMQVYLLCQILQNSNPMADCSPQAIRDASSCFRCSLSGKELYAAMVYLLCQILDTGGGGGGGGATPGVLWIYWEAAHVDDNPPANPTFAYMRRFLNGDPPVIWNPTAAQWL